MLTSAKDYRTLCDNFQWEVPVNYNIGVDICDKWAGQPDRLALIYESENGRIERYTFRDLKQRSNRLANGLRALGIGSGDRVGILLPQRPETAISHIAIYKLGAIAIPLFTLFGTDALSYRLGNSEARGVITDAANLPKILAIRDSLPQLKVILVTEGDLPEGITDFQGLLEKGSSQFAPVQTRADDPALIIYTSGTTGPPKVPCTPTACCWATSPVLNSRTIFFPARTTGSGRRRTGPGSGGSSMCFCPAGTMAFPLSPIGPESSTRRRPSTCWPGTASATPSCRPRP
jgi:non-ribosomal peptide synthetase component F